VISSTNWHQKGNPIRKNLTISQCGTADVPLTRGRKAPDLSLYEVKPTGTGQGDNKDNDDDNSILTVVYEYAYSEDSAKLARDSAHHLLLSRGRVQLVVAVDVSPVLSLS
jgi:hypothetical protein